MSREGNNECNQPANEVGQERRILDVSDSHDGGHPVSCRCGAAHGDETDDLSNKASHRYPMEKVAGVGTRSTADRPIMICADDFGMGAGINSGILELASCRRLSAVSCLSRGSFFARAARHLRSLPVDKGMHLNLTEGLCDDDFHLPLRRLIMSCWARRLDPQLVRQEIDKQLDAFEMALDQPPDYVDGHQHVHQFPVIRETLLDVLGRRYGSHLPWLRSTCAIRASSSASAIRLKAWLIEALGGSATARLASREGFRMNARLLGIYGFGGGHEAYWRLLDAWFAEAGAGDLLMCHPSAFADPGDRLGRQREAEYSVLRSERFPRLLIEHGLQLARSSTAISAGVC